MLSASRSFVRPFMCIGRVLGPAGVTVLEAFCLLAFLGGLGGRGPAVTLPGVITTLGARLELAAENSSPAAPWYRTVGC